MPRPGRCVTGRNARGKFCDTRREIKGLPALTAGSAVPRYNAEYGGHGASRWAPSHARASSGPDFIDSGGLKAVPAKAS